MPDPKILNCPYRVEFFGSTIFLAHLPYWPRKNTGVKKPDCKSGLAGSADIKQILKDIMALTKLNYNACIFADGEPVTLRFADKIGDILTAAKSIKALPLAFKYYI